MNFGIIDTKYIHIKMRFQGKNFVTTEDLYIIREMHFVTKYGIINLKE